VYGERGCLAIDFENGTSDYGYSILGFFVIHDKTMVVGSARERGDGATPGII